LVPKSGVQVAVLTIVPSIPGFNIKFLTVSSVTQTVSAALVYTFGNPSSYSILNSGFVAIDRVGHVRVHVRGFAEVLRVPSFVQRQLPEFLVVLIGVSD